MMAIRPYVIIAVALCVAGGLGFVAGLRTGLSKSGAQVQELQIQAAQAKGGEDAAKAQADQAREDAQAWADRALDAGQRIEALKAKLAKIKPQAPDPLPGLPPVDPVVDGPVESIVAVQAELIEAQEVKITALEGQVSAQGEQIKGLEKALVLADRRADIQAQASKAAAQGIMKSRWLGRVEGFAAGLAVGYVGGRVR